MPCVPQLQDPEEPSISIYLQYLPVSRLGARLLPSLDVVASRFQGELSRC